VLEDVWHSWLPQVPACLIPMVKKMIWTTFAGTLATRELAQFWRILKIDKFHHYFSN
jgi:hypothetical protein